MLYIYKSLKRVAVNQNWLGGGGYYSLLALKVVLVFFLLTKTLSTIADFRVLFLAVV